MRSVTFSEAVKELQNTWLLRKQGQNLKGKKATDACLELALGFYAAMKLVDGPDISTVTFLIAVRGHEYLETFEIKEAA